jgi:hypothetical protein
MSDGGGGDDDDNNDNHDYSYVDIVIPILHVLLFVPLEISWLSFCIVHVLMYYSVGRLKDWSGWGTHTSSGTGSRLRAAAAADFPSITKCTRGVTEVPCYQHSDPE